jgi:hypothetical protein
VNWRPNITNGKVEGIVQVGDRMIVAGTFTQARNAGSTTTLTRNRILAFSATGGAIDTAFAPNVNGEITSMVVAPGGTAVIIAGAFTSVNGVAATRIAKLDAVTGARITAFTATAAGTVNDMALWGSRAISSSSRSIGTYATQTNPEAWDGEDCSQAIQARGLGAGLELTRAATSDPR